MHACKDGHTQIVKELLQVECDIERRDLVSSLAFICDPLADIVFIPAIMEIPMNLYLNVLFMFRDFKYLRSFFVFKQICIPTNI